MRKLTLTLTLLLLLSTSSVMAGQPSYDVGWVTGTAADQLVINNDDYTGLFSENPNQLYINNTNEAFPDDDFTQDLGFIERVVPVEPTGGITEYAVSVAGAWGEGEVPFDALFAVQLGFGTGENFTLAGDIVPDLAFDQADAVDPAVPNFYYFTPDDPEALLELVEHQGDTLIFQGNNPVTTVAGEFLLGSIYDTTMFRFPLDVPDLPELVRDLYLPADLEGLPASAVPFTLRVVLVPEPSIGVLSGGMLLGLGRLRLRSRS